MVRKHVRRGDSVSAASGLFVHQRRVEDSEDCICREVCMLLPHLALEERYQSVPQPSDSLRNVYLARIGNFTFVILKKSLFGLGRQLLPRLCEIDFVGNPLKCFLQRLGRKFIAFPAWVPSPRAL